MSERLQRFRKLMAAFEGTSNPQQAIERGYYVDLPNNPMAEITRRVELRPSSVHLLLGGIGSGKTTQLLLAQEHLNRLEVFKAIYVDVSLYTDISKIERGALIAIAGLEIIRLLDKSDDPELDKNQELIKAKEIIKKSAYGNNETKVILTPLSRSLSEEKQKLQEKLNPFKSIDMPSFSSLVPQVIKDVRRLNEIESSGRQIITTYKKGLLSEKRKGGKDKLLENFLTLSRIFSENTENKREIIFIFDGLDRINNTNLFIDCILNDIILFPEMGIYAIIVGSIPIIYTKEILNFSSYLHYFPYLDITEDIKAKDFFMNILNLRDSDNFITLEAKKFLITQSGGVLRDLMSLTQSAIEEAYVDGSDNITLEHAEEAVNSLARSKFMGLTDTNLETLQKVISQKIFTPRTPEELELLLTGHILEYRHPRKHFAVHPVLVPLIQENKNLSVVHG
ncbi:MAG: hypothetical protein VKL42_15390 [Snowella sp.]|nr:hypothetical protein [Snowella sp.]